MITTPITIQALINRLDDEETGINYNIPNWKPDTNTLYMTKFSAKQKSSWDSSAPIESIRRYKVTLNNDGLVIEANELLPTNPDYFK